MSELVKNETQIATPAELLNQAISKGIDPDKLDKLLEVYEKWQASQDLKELQARLSEAKKCFKKIKRSRQGNNHKYASLDDIMAAISKPLVRQGIVLSFHECGLYKVGDMIILKTIAKVQYKSALIESSHESPIDWHGQKDKRMNVAQAFGSSSTYSKRYALCNLLGIELQGDDDAQSVDQPNQARVNNQKNLKKAQQTPKQPVQQSKPTFWSNPVVATKAKISEAGNDAPKLRKLYDFIDNKWEEKGINAEIAQQCLDEVLGALRHIEQSKPQGGQQGIFVQEPSPLGFKAMPAIPVVEQALNKSNEVLQKSKEVVSA